MKRYGWAIRLRPGKVEEYKRLHREVWPGVLATISACGIRNYSIFLKRFDDGRDYLFASFEHTGADLKADLQKMTADPITRKWWTLTDPLQEPIGTRNEGEWWADMEEVFRYDGPAD
jgi:L-rhamnose mutarotase